MHFIQNHTRIVIKDQKTGIEYTVLDTKTQVTGQVVAGMPSIDVIDDSLDSFVFVLKNHAQRKPFSPYSYVTYTIDDGKKEETTNMFVLFDNVKTYSRASNTYEHTITCVETTKILETIKVFNLNLTNPTNTLYEQLNRACFNAEPYFTEGRYGKKRRLYIVDSYKRLLEKEPSRDFYFENTDFRSVLDEMFSGLNARAIVESVEFEDDGKGKDISKINIGFVSMNQISSTTPSWTREAQGEIIYEESENDGQNYGGTICGRGYNSLPEEAITVTDFFKSDASTATTDNICAFTPFPISDKGIKRFVVKGNYVDQRDESNKKTEKIDLDITDKFITKETFELLSVKDKEDWFFYEIGSAKIGVAGDIKINTGIIVWKNEKMESFLADAFKKQLNLSDSYNGGDYSIPVNDWKNWAFECEYYPTIDTVASVSKPNSYNKTQLLMGIMDSQTEKTLDIERHGKKLAGLIRRTGNDEYYVDVKAKYYSKLLPLMSKIDLPNADSDEEKGYVLYKREYSIYDNFINCRYYFSKDYNAVQKNAGVNREKHLYDIPLESSETPIVIKQYLQFSFDDIRSNEDSLKDETYKSLFSFIDDDEENHKKLSYLLFMSEARGFNYPQYTETSDETKPYIDLVGKLTFALPTANYTHNTTMYFVAKCRDNYSVDYSRDGYVFSIWGDGGHRITYNRYVDRGEANPANPDDGYIEEGSETRVGECDKFVMSYAFPSDVLPTFEWTQEGLGEEGRYEKTFTAYYPIVKKDEYTAATDTFTYYYYKDRTQTPLFVYALECVPAKKDYGNIIIGTEFARKNCLVRGTDDLTELEFYVGESNVLNGDETTVPSGFRKITGIRIKLEEAGSKGAKLSPKSAGQGNVTAWAIADKQGNIYLAANGNIRPIYVSVVNSPN